MERLIAFALGQRLLVLLATVLLIGWGIYSFKQLPIDAFPDLTNVQVQILATAEGKAPNEVERLVTFPIEVEMNGLPNVTEVRSQSKFGLSVITVVFRDSVDTYFARSLVAQKLQGVAPELPDVLLLSVGHHGQAFLHRLTPPNLVFPGMVSTRAKDLLLRSADVALNPMRQGSGTNLKLLEYLAVGVPVVSTPFGARGIEVVDGEHLLLAEPTRFAAAVRTTLDDPVAAARRAEAGRALVRDRYGWDGLGRRLATLIDERVQRTPSQ